MVKAFFQQHTISIIKLTPPYQRHYWRQHDSTSCVLIVPSFKDLCL